MEIKYLTKLKETPKIGRWENRGVPETKIEGLENQLKIKLPLAFKEYLFLAGEFNNIIGDWDGSFGDLDWIQDQAKESMENVNLSLKPYFAFAEYGRDQFLFFFLNEGDNPAVYTYDEMKIHKDEQGNQTYYKMTKPSFVNFVEKHIDEALKK
jgi:hypothetical protein